MGLSSRSSISRASFRSNKIFGSGPAKRNGRFEQGVGGRPKMKNTGQTTITFKSDPYVQKGRLGAAPANTGSLVPPGLSDKELRIFTVANLYKAQRLREEVQLFQAARARGDSRAMQETKARVEWLANLKDRELINFWLDKSSNRSQQK